MRPTSCVPWAAIALVVACSSSTPAAGPSLRENSSGDEEDSSKHTKKSDNAPTPTKPTPNPDPGSSSTPTPAPSPTTSSKPPPAKPQGCAAAKCIGLGGTCGCSVASEKGIIGMGCDQGQCLCFGGNNVQGDNAVFQGDCNTSDDALSLMIVNCTCN